MTGYSTFYVILQPNFTIVLIKLLMTLFPAVVMNLSNSQVRLKGERSIYDAFRRYFGITIRVKLFKTRITRVYSELFTSRAK